MAIFAITTLAVMGACILAYVAGRWDERRIGGAAERAARREAEEWLAMSTDERLDRMEREGLWDSVADATRDAISRSLKRSRDAN